MPRCHAPDSRRLAGRARAAADPAPRAARVDAFPPCKASFPPIGRGSRVPLGGAGPARPLVPAG